MIIVKAGTMAWRGFAYFEAGQRREVTIYTPGLSYGTMIDGSAIAFSIATEKEKNGGVNLDQ